MLINFKNNIKYNFPKVYKLIRTLIFSYYIKARQIKLNKFKIENENKVIKNINFAGVKYKLVLDKVNGFVDEEIYWKGVYEEEVMMALQKEIMSCTSPLSESRRGTGRECEIIFLDIGANIGQELIFAGAVAQDIFNKNSLKEKLSMSFRAIGFEPIKSLYEQVNQSIKINNLENNVYTYNFALGDKDEELILKSPIINVGGSSLVRNENNTVGDMREQKIKVKRGDGVFIDILNNLDLDNKKENDIKLIIKIDVEGFEYEVIKGLGNTIKKYEPTIILEYSPAFYIKNSAMGDRSQIGIEILKIFKDENYTIEIIDIGEYKNKIYKGEQIINWGNNFKGEQANLLLHKI